MGMKKVNQPLSRELADACSILSLRIRKERGLLLQGNCYHDALHVAARLGNRAYYCEGWAKSSLGLFVEHAWVWYNGAVVDATWESDDLGEAEYYTTLCISIGRLLRGKGYQPPIVMDKGALRHFGIDRSISRIHSSRLLELYHLQGFR